MDGTVKGSSQWNEGVCVYSGVKHRGWAGCPSLLGDRHPTHRIPMVC